MSDPRWTVDEDGDIVFGDALAEIVHEDDTPYVVKKAAYDALVECVRSHDTLTRARELMEQIARVPFSHYVRWREDGNTESAEVLFDFERAHKALLDLLTGEGQ